MRTSNSLKDSEEKPLEEKIIESCENSTLVEQDLSEISELYEFSDIFSDGKSEPLTPDFHKISKEVEDALEKDRLEKLQNSVTSSIEEGVIEELQNSSTSDIEEEVIEELSVDRGTSESIDKEPTNVEKVKSVNNLGKKIAITSVAIVSIAGVSLGTSYFKNMNSVDGLEKQIDKLYTSSRKDDIKDSVDNDKLSKYYDKLEDLGDNSETDSIQSELDNISYFLADKNILNEINNSSYDLNSSDLQSKLDKVKTSAMGYSISGLSESILKTIEQINSDYSYFIELRDELSLIKDYENVDIKGYQTKINNISHKPNRDELQLVLNNIEKNIKISDTVNDIKDASEEKINEVVGEASSSLGSKLDSISESIKNLVPNILEGIKSIFSSEKS